METQVTKSEAANKAPSQYSVLKKRSAEIARTVKDIGVEIHKHLCSIMEHTIEHRDVSLFTHFVNLLEMKDGDGNSHSIIRVNAIKSWVAQFGPARYGRTKDGKPGFKLKADMLDAILETDEKRKEHVRTARATPYNKFEPEKELPSFDFDRALKALVERAEKAMKNKKDFRKVTINQEHLDSAKALLN